MAPAPPSTHLSWDELACHDGTPYPESWRTTRLPILAREFEAFRETCGGRALAVISGFRTRARNQQVGGARFSQHVTGRALDIRTPRHLTVEQFHGLARGFAGRPGSHTRGLGYYPWGVHIDTRPVTRLAVWSGARSVADDPRRRT